MQLSSLSSFNYRSGFTGSGQQSSRFEDQSSEETEVPQSDEKPASSTDVGFASSLSTLPTEQDNVFVEEDGAYRMGSSASYSAFGAPVASVFVTRW